MKEVTYKNHTWKEMEPSDLDNLDLTSEQGKQALQNMSAEMAEARKNVPTDLIFEHQFVEWFNNKAKPAYEKQQHCSIDELFRFSAYQDLDAVIAYTYRMTEREGRPLLLSSFQSVLKHALGYGIEQRDSHLQFKKLQNRNIKIEAAGLHVCDRCSGSGNWNMRDGYTCFKCGGSGYLDKNVA